MTQNAASPVFRPIYIIWTLFGLNTHVSKSDPYYVLKKVILSIKWIIISCFLFYTYVGAFLSLKELNLEFKLDDKNLFQYNYLSFIVFNMVTWVCMFYFNRKFPKFVEMLNLINPYPPELWRKEKLKRMSKFITYGTYLSLVFPSMFFGISTSGLIYFPYQYFPTYYPSWVNYSFIIHSILNGHIFCTSVVSMLIIINILKCFNEKVKTVLDNVVDDTSAVKTVDDLFQCHCDFVAITKIVDELNSTFSHLITISHVYFFGGICVTSFIFTKGSLSLGVLLTFSILSIMWLVIFLCMWYLSSCVYDQGQMSKVTLISLFATSSERYRENGKLLQQIHLQITLLMKHIEIAEIGVTVSDLAIVNRSYILNVVSLIVTYFFVIMEFDTTIDCCQYWNATSKW